MKVPPMISKCVRPVCLVAVMHAAAMAQAAWTQVASGGPPARWLHSMTYDSQRQRVVLFGGSANFGSGVVSLSDTWEWDGIAWSQAATTGPAGPYSVIAYDSQRGRTVAVTTGGAASTYETWEWDGATWALRYSGSTPAAPFGFSAMTYDSQRGRTVLITGGSTWEWDGTAWTSMSATGPLVFFPSICFDSVRGMSVLQFGASTWERAAGDWQLVSQSGPPRLYASMVFDANAGQAVLFGGQSGGVSLGDAWTWNGSAWSHSAAIGPAGRHQHAMAFDSARSRTVLFGGVDVSHFAQGLGDTWELLGTLAIVAAYGTACGAPPVTIGPHPNSRPILGHTQINDIANATVGFAAVAWGLTSQSLPLDFVGINGCTLLNGAEMEVGSFCASTSFNSAQHSLPIPLDLTLLGVHVYLQAWTLAPGFNPVGVKMSNGVELVIGDV